MRRAPRCPTSGRPSRARGRAIQGQAPLLSQLEDRLGDTVRAVLERGFRASLWVCVVPRAARVRPARVAVAKEPGVSARSRGLVLLAVAIAASGGLVIASLAQRRTRPRRGPARESLQPPGAARRRRNLGHDRAGRARRARRCGVPPAGLARAPGRRPHDGSGPAEAVRLGAASRTIGSSRPCVQDCDARSTTLPVGVSSTGSISPCSGQRPTTCRSPS